MKLYSYFRSSSSYRVRVALALKGVAYEYLALDLSPDACAQLTDDFTRVNPMQQIPVLVWTEGGIEQRLTQSVAIIEYLDERFPNPPLLPKDPLARARVREAVQIVNAGIQPLQNPGTLRFLHEHAGHEASKRFRNEAIEKGLAALEHLAQRAGGPHFLGDPLSMADLYIVPQLYNARRYHVELAPFPRLRAIEAGCLTLSAFRAAAPENQPDSPPL